MNTLEKRQIKREIEEARIEMVEARREIEVSERWYTREMEEVERRIIRKMEKAKRKYKKAKKLFKDDLPEDDIISDCAPAS